ncbi:MAG: peroxiredoxin [Alphaproteobacteria bacterium]
MNPATGLAAPDFTLPVDGGATLSLRELRGRWVVLYFYPRDNTPGCTTEALDFRDFAPDFAALGAVVVGISRDSVKSHDGFKAKHALPFLLASDEDASVCQAYGVWQEKTRYGRTSLGIERSTFLIDAAGVVREVWSKVKVADHAAAVLSALRQHLGKEEGEK